MNGPAIPASSPWVAAIGWMLVHSLWQGAGVAMALALVLCVLRRAPARARYRAACAAMILLVALPIATVCRSDVPRPVPQVHHDATVEPTIGVGVTPIAPGVRFTPRTAGLGVAEWLEPMLPAVVALWMTGVGVFSLRLLGGWIQARRWVRNHTRPLADPWPDRVERLKQRLGVRRAVAMLESARVEVPMVVGCLRPVILVPVAALSGLSVPELEAILAHELAHIRRHDYLVNLIQCVVEVLVFYHPATWWISRIIRREREVCCDDLAVAACRDRVAYARALAAMEGLRVPAFSPSPAANGGILLARVRRILNPQEESMNPVRILAGLAVVLAAAPLWFARADADKPAPAATAPSPEDPFPNRSFADVVTQIEAAPTGRFLISPGSLPAGGPRVWADLGVRQEIRDWKDLDDGTLALVQGYLPRQDAPAKLTAEPEPRPQSAASDVSGRITVLKTSDIPDNPPSEAEVWARFIESKTDSRPYYETRRNCVRIVVEKIGDKVDPVESYPRAGTFERIHSRFRCTVSYQEIRESDYPIPLRNVDDKVEVFHFTRDFFRRARPTPAGDLVDDRIDRLSREIAELKRTRQRDRHEQERILDRLIGELEGLKRELRDDPKGAGGSK